MYELLTCILYICMICITCTQQIILISVWSPVSWHTNANAAATAAIIHRELHTSISKYYLKCSIQEWLVKVVSDK